MTNKPQQTAVAIKFAWFLTSGPSAAFSVHPDCRQSEGGLGGLGRGRFLDLLTSVLMLLTSLPSCSFCQLSCFTECIRVSNVKHSKLHWMGAVLHCRFRTRLVLFCVLPFLGLIADSWETAFIKAPLINPFVSLTAYSGSRWFHGLHWIRRHDRLWQGCTHTHSERNQIFCLLLDYLDNPDPPEISVRFTQGSTKKADTPAHRIQWGSDSMAIIQGMCLGHEPVRKCKNIHRHKGIRTEKNLPSLFPKSGMIKKVSGTGSPMSWIKWTELTLVDK